MLYSLKNAIEMKQSLPVILLAAFLAGILISFTPCIYPMIPITAGILQAQATRSVFHNFLRAVSYVLGVAIVYATLGYIVATTTLIFGQWFANPWFIAFVVIFFLYFGFAMFGFYDVYIPAFLRSRTTFQTRGSFITAFFLGAISGTVTSPCLTPALAVLLGYVAKIGNPITGFLMLFAFSLGMGMLLILVGTFSGMLHVLPSAGNWMIEVKKIFGFLILGICVYILDPLLPPYATFILYGGIVTSASMYYIIRCNKIKA
jgi:thiol:disulfide interchange protein DsbD